MTVRIFTLAIGLFVFHSSHAQSVSDLKTDIEKKKQEIFISQQTTAMESLVIKYNSEAEQLSLPTIQPSSLQGELTNGMFGSQDMEFAGMLSDGTICTIKNLRHAPVNTTPNPTIGSSESWWNNEYSVIKLNCSDAQVRFLVMTVDGQDWLDNINPDQNSGVSHYEIRSRAATPYDSL